jgi:hypothetical protein
MTSETDFSARVFEIYANIINDIIFSCVSEDQRVTSIFNMFTFIYLNIYIYIFIYIYGGTP